MPTSRFLALLGCGVALLVGLAALALPQQAMALALTAAIAAGVAMAAILVGRPAEPAETPVARIDPAPVPHPAADTDLLAELERYKALEQQLTAAKHEAEAATMAKGEFLATMSHEIRTPLNGVIPLLDLLLSTPLAPDQRDYLETAYGSSRELLRIVDDILDYSKLDASKLQLETVGINLRELTTNVLRLMEKSAEAKGLRLGLAIDPAVRLAVRGDPVRLRQVLTNLVSNAIKFTERGSVSVHVSRIGQTRTRNQLRFEVRDTGIGIAPEAAAQLFQPFSQADASTTRTFGGTGLGLAICKRIVTLMGGRIGVDSAPGKGSTFWFEVALDKALGDIEGRSPTDAGNTRVLLVTANAAQHRRFSLALPQWGMALVHAANTQDALTRIRSLAQKPGQRGFDIVLVDLASIPTTALALHRALVRDTRPDQVLRVYLRTEDALPAELESTPGFHMLMRDSADSELRARLTALLDVCADAPAEIASADSGERTPEPAAKLVGDVAAAAPVPEPPAPPPLRPVPAPAPLAPAVAPAPVAPVPAPVLAPVAPASSSPAPAHGDRVLLVEDNPVNRQVAQRLLSLASIAFDSAENGKEALDKMNAEGYIAVLMDCQMPIMDGYTATRQRRQHEQTHGLARLPIIAMTANAMLGDREKCLDAGMDDYLSKPLNRALLESTLRTWMGNATAAPVPVATPTPPSRPRLVVAPAAVPTTPAIDQSILDELREVMGAEFTSLVRVFLVDAPLAIDRIQTLAAQQDTAAIAAPAHTLKSTSANLGALPLSTQARALEQDARHGTLSDAEMKAAALAAEFERVAAALRPLLAG